MSTPVIEYWPLRGRAEVMRLALACKGIEWEEKMTDYATMKSDRAAYPFGQAPRFVDGDVSLVQSNAILRFIGRKYKLQGTTEKDVCQVDMILEGVESLRSKYIGLIYTDELAEEAKTKYWATHGDKAGASGRCGGAHLDFLAAFIRDNASGFTTGSDVTIADLAVFDIVDLHNRIFADKLKEVYPELLEFHQKIEALEGVKAYRASPRCFEKINGNSLG